MHHNFPEILKTILAMTCCERRHTLDLTLHKIQFRNGGVNRDWVKGTRKTLLDICKNNDIGSEEDDARTDLPHKIIYENYKKRQKENMDLVRLCSDKDLLIFLSELWRRNDAPLEHMKRADETEVTPQ